jgi:prenyl protein peptidase
MFVWDLFPLSPLYAVLISTFYASLYVGSMYLWVFFVPFLPISEEQRLSMVRKLKIRDDPLTIKYRFVSATLATLTCLLLNLAISTEGISTTLAAMGIRFDLHYIVISVLPLALVMILFAGPLTLLLVDSESPFTFENSLLLIRNLIICPITEELVFRGSIIPLLLGCGFSRSQVIFFSPFFFGAAHLHHVFAGASVIIVLFQFCFTSLFGWISAFIFVRTGSVLASILAHTFCNLMGFPEFGRIPTHPQKNVLLFSFVMGIVLFFALLEPMTEPSLYENRVFY